MKKLSVRNVLKKQWLIYCLAFALVGGVIMLVSTFAATGAANIEPENGSPTSRVQIQNDSAASGGKAVMFSANATTQPVVLPNPGTWSNVTANLAGMSSECGNLPWMSAKPNSNMVIAGIAQQGLWATTNSGASWQKLGTGNGSATITNRPSFISYDPTNANTWYESGIYNGNGVYKTTDNGVTFQALGSLGHIDYISIDYSDPNRQTIIAGPHEQSRTIWKTTNGGQTWTDIGKSLPDGTNFSVNPVLINSQTYVVSSNNSWAGGSVGMYRTTNGGTTWTKVSDLGGNGTVPLHASDGTIYYSSRGNLIRSTDQGVTWAEVGNGQNINYWAPTELPDGRIMTAAGNRLIVSADKGNTWTPFGATLPFSPYGYIYSSGDQAIYIYQWDCGNAVLPNAIYRLK